MPHQLVRIMTVCCVMACTAIASAPAFAAGSCLPPDKAPSVVVHIDIRQPMIDHTQARDRLKTFDVATVSPYQESRHVHVNGIMRGTISLETQSAVAWQYTRDGAQNCFWYDQIEVILRLNPTIYIANEIPYASCLYKEVMEHEFKHFNTDFQIAKDYQTVLERELGQLIQRVGVIGPYVRDMGMKPKDDLLHRLELVVGSVSERMKKDRLDRQAKIDTREEYDRVAAACPEDMQRY